MDTLGEWTQSNDPKQVRPQQHHSPTATSVNPSEIISGGRLIRPQSFV
jgi:hypothetical protein